MPLAASDTEMATAFINNGPAERDVPFYQPVGNECQLFEQAYRQRLPLLLKGPTGCGKTRFVSHMAAKLGPNGFAIWTAANVVTPFSKVQSISRLLRTSPCACQAITPKKTAMSRICKAVPI